jgi:hypothetical protein
MTSAMTLGIRHCKLVAVIIVIIAVSTAMAFCFTFVLFCCDVFLRLSVFYVSATSGS